MPDVSPADINRFFSDVRLPLFAERLKSSSDLLDIVRLNENQHSDVLKWCLSPREAHGQGEEILRDFLLAASSAADGQRDSTSSTARFFKKWTPAAIVATGLSGAFVLREFVISDSSRCDLLIVDLQNRFLVVVENKRQARMDDGQLARYETELIDIFNGDAKTTRFSVAFVALDIEPLGESDTAFALMRTRWAFLDYEWLRRSAARAQIHLERGNASAHLVLAYCEHQLQDIGDPSEELAAALVSDHPAVVAELRRVPPRELRSTLLRELGNRNPIAIFALQNMELVRRLLRVTLIASLATRLRREASFLAIRTRRSVVDLLPQDVLARWMWHRDDLPFAIRCRRLSDSESGIARYRVRLIWFAITDEAEARSDMLSTATALFSQIKANTVLEMQTMKRVTVIDNASEDRAVEKIIELARKISMLATN